ncbi:MAG: glycosyltransferase family A protein [Planctomycetia bacterium]|nr:glycosyltransferase family A protein [Planctomycetia bacterium]
MTRISTIIPVYNGEKYLRECLDSALAQVGVEQEILVVNDGSTDGTAAILDEYAARVRVLTQHNAGHIAARNHGVAEATGQWLAFLDADDLWEPTKLCEQEKLLADDIGMVYTERLNFGDLGDLPARQSESQTLYDGDLFHPLLQTNFITVSSVLLRKDLYRELGGFDPAPTGCEDWDLWLRFAATYGPDRFRVACVREPLTRYRWRSDAMTRNLSLMHHGREIALENALASSRGKREITPSERRQARASICEISAWVARQSGQRGLAFSYAARRFFLTPGLRTLYHWVKTLFP